mgnify:CR=1 FL=1
MASKYQRKFAVGVGSATDGLFLALKALGLTDKSTIACPVYSYIATSGAIKRLGAKIKFIDVDTQGNMGPIDPKIQVDAVLYTNLFGNVADYPRLRKYCDKNHIPLIEDAAQSQGAWHHGVQSGKLGSISIFFISLLPGWLIFRKPHQHYQKNNQYWQSFSIISEITNGSGGPII